MSAERLRVGLAGGERQMSRGRQARKDAPDDGALVEMLAAGDLSALGVLYDRYGEDIRRFVFRAAGERAVADDITHDAFLALVDSADRFDAQQSARSYLIGIAGKLLLRRRRKLAQLRRWFTELKQRAVRETPTPEQDAAAHQELSRYGEALRRMSLKKRLVLVMATEGMSGRDIAAALEIPLGTVWTRLHHARSELRQSLNWPLASQEGRHS